MKRFCFLCLAVLIAVSLIAAGEAVGPQPDVSDRARQVLFLGNDLEVHLVGSSDHGSVREIRNVRGIAFSTANEFTLESDGTNSVIRLSDGAGTHSVILQGISSLTFSGPQSPKGLAANMFTSVLLSGLCCDDCVSYDNMVDDIETGGCVLGCPGCSCEICVCNSCNEDMALTMGYDGFNMYEQFAAH